MYKDSKDNILALKYAINLLKYMLQFKTPEVNVGGNLQLTIDLNDLSFCITAHHNDYIM